MYDVTDGDDMTDRIATGVGHLVDEQLAGIGDTNGDADEVAGRALDADALTDRRQPRPVHLADRLLETAGEAVQPGGQQHITIDGRQCRRSGGRPAQVAAHADDDVVDSAIDRAGLGEDASKLGAVEQEIVRPLQRRTPVGARLDRLGGGNGDALGQLVRVGRVEAATEQHRDEEVRPRWGVPPPIQPTTPRGLVIGHQHGPVRCAHRHQGALRLAVPVSKISQQVDAVRGKVLWSTALGFIPSLLLAAIVSRHVSKRLASIIEYAGKLAQGDFSARLPQPKHDELGILETKLADTGAKLERMVGELDREHAELEKLERVRKDFVINVSHELRTPLASIQGYTETLLDGAIHDPRHNVKFLGIIRQNAERLGRLTADLLTLSRIELGRQRFQFASYYVNRLIEENIDSMRPLAAKKNIRIDIESEGVSNEIGLIAPNTLVKFEEMAFLMSDRGPYMVSEGGVKEIGLKVANEFDFGNRAAWAGAATASAARNPNSTRRIRRKVAAQTSVTSDR